MKTKTTVFYNNIFKKIKNWILKVFNKKEINHNASFLNLDIKENNFRDKVKFSNELSMDEKQLLLRFENDLGLNNFNEAEIKKIEEIYNKKTTY